ncbi:MAG: MoxR family ATPase [Pirellulaceae bacterium]|nr:MoxR family ATPase [Pirellulaceae bacterium]
MNFLGMRESRTSIESVSLESLQPTVGQLANKIAEVIRGKATLIRDFLIGVVAGGSILLEDFPGVGKTTLAKTFAQLIDLKFDRLQCTADLLPADVLGFSVYNSQEGQFKFRSGPIFCNVLLIDEINRASPRTQSALLEAMAERQVTIDGCSRRLPSPFLVIATQNPQGFQGTYPLPEAQLDRFLFNLAIDYPDHASEVELLYDPEAQSRQPQSPILSAEELTALQCSVLDVGVHRDIADYIVRIVRATRECDEIQLGCSPRGSQMLFRAAQAAAFVAGRSHVLPDDVQHVAPLTLAHRIVGKRGASPQHLAKRGLIAKILTGVRVPT